jgi:hypothetical protein
MCVCNPFCLSAYLTEPTGKPAKSVSDGAGFEPVKYQPTFLVAKRAGDDENEVNDNPYSKSSKGQEHQNAGAHFPYIKSVYSKGTQKETEE